MTFNELNTEILSLENLPGSEFFIIGYSTLGQPIYALHLGNYEGKQILIEGGIHAREYPSSLVVIKIAKYLTEQELSGGVYIIPLSNPDGARLILDGVDFLPCDKLKEYVNLINDGSSDYSQWKANAMAVDLNVNFDALWGEGSQNVFCPAPSNFVGYYPNSEREVNVLIDFTYRVMPDLTLSFHTKGEVNYYGFAGLTPTELARDEELAKYISSINGYAPIKTENSVGGYSDWVGLFIKVPAFTIEIGPVTAPTPVPLEYVEDAYIRNRDLPILLLNKLNGEQS